MKHQYLKLKQQIQAHSKKPLFKNFLTHLTEAAYGIASKTGFRKGFILFLSDLEKVLAHVIQKDKTIAHKQRA